MGNPQEGFVFRPPVWYNETMISPQYLAGLIDGEGYLGLLPSRVKGLKNPSFEPVIKIGMTGQSAYDIMYALKERYTGNIEQRSKLTTGGRIAYTINLKGKKRVAQVIADIYPYLIVKKPQAALLLEFCDLPSTHSNYATFSQDVLNRKIELYKELKDLKKAESLAETE